MTEKWEISPLRRILVGLACDEDVTAKSRYTAELAKRHNAHVTLLAVTDIERLKAVGPVPAGASHHAKQLREGRILKSRILTDQAIAAFEKEMSKAGLQLDVRQVDDDPLHALALAWRSHDLTLLGLKGWFDHSILGEPKDALYKVIDKGIRPILAIPRDHSTVKNAVVFYNGSMESAKSMKQFVRFRLWPDARIHLTCINEPVTREPVHDLLEEASALCRGPWFRGGHERAERRGCQPDHGCPSPCRTGRSAGHRRRFPPLPAAQAFRPPYPAPDRAA